MTTETSSAAFVPRGHPVRNFVLAIFGLAFGSIGLWWSGAITPRIGFGGTAMVARDEEPRTLRVEVKNDGPFAVDIIGVKPEDVRARVLSFHVDGASDGVIQGGTSMDLVVLYEIDCEQHPRSSTLGLVELVAKGPLRVTRHVNIGEHFGNFLCKE